MKTLTYQKEMLIPYLKKQLQEMSEWITRMESGDTLEEVTLRCYFSQKQKDDKRFLKNLCRKA